MIHRKGFRMLFPKAQTHFLGLLCLLGVTATLICCSIATMGLVFLAGHMPSGSEWVMEQLPTTVGVLLVVSLAISVPAMTLVGAFASMPLFGALHRIHQYLESVANGEETQELKLRDKDPLHNLADAVNGATLKKRASNQADEPYSQAA